MSNSKEIREVFEQDIANKTQQVRSRFGNAPFYDYYTDLSIKRVYDGVLSSEDEDMLERLANKILEEESFFMGDDDLPAENEDDE